MEPGMENKQPSMERALVLKLFIFGELAPSLVETKHVP